MNKRVLVGLSGGVDSSMAAAILAEKGYDVIGVTLKLYDYAELKFDPPDGGCCTIDLINDARAVCDRLGIPHYVIDLRQSFEKNVIDDFIDSYTRGRTPNPCINCNRFIKWGEMLRLADKLDCAYVATGHYARVEHRDNEKSRLLRACDLSKDQSYALWGISLDALARTLLPIGDYAKTEIRGMSRERGLCNSDRPDSQEICFVPTGDYAAIVRERRGSDKSLVPGPILDVGGRQIGEHRGYAYYTIGQRKGFGISSPEPLYVTKINPEDNSITVGVWEYLFSRNFTVMDISLLVDPGEMPEKIEVKIRYRHEAGPATIKIEEGRAQIEFHNPERAITPGQSAVFYSGERVLGGGIIERVL